MLLQGGERPLFGECEYGNLHYDITTGVIENIDNSNEILVTSFLNYGTPLIRYRIGDSMVLKSTINCVSVVLIPPH